MSSISSQHWDFSQNVRPASAGASAIEKLPPELLRKILVFVTQNRNIQTSCCMGKSLPRNVNAKVIPEHTSLFPCLLVSRRLNTAALALIYRNPKFNTPSSFNKLARQIIIYPELGEHIRRLDLSQLTLTHPSQEWSNHKTPLHQVLYHAPLLREFRLPPDLQDEIDQSMLENLFCELRHLECLRLEFCTSALLTSSFTQFFENSSPRIASSITELSLRGCSSLSSQIFADILEQLPRLRVLDVARTQITADALANVSECARIEHLNISHCSSLSSPDFASFLSSHPAIQNSLVSLQAKTTPEEQIFEVEDLAKMLANLPQTLRSLNLAGSPMLGLHVAYLKPLSQNLEELNVGSHLRMRDLEDMILGERFQFAAEEDSELEGGGGEGGVESKYRSVMQPMESAVGICKLRQRLGSVTQLQNPDSGSNASTLRHLDISSMEVPEQAKIGMSVLLGNESGLDVIEIEEGVGSIGGLKELCRAVGWRVRCVGRRCWIEKKV